MSRPTYLIHPFRLGLVFTQRADGRMTIDTRDFDALRRLLGDDLLCAFLRLFVWTDRAASLLHLGYWGLKNLPEGSAALGRDFQTIVWFASGLLFEAADAIEEMQKAGITHHLRTTEHWDKLQAMASRWTRNKFLRRARNNLGFHATTKEMKAGIAILAARGERLTIIEADDTTLARSTFRIGLEALLAGIGATMTQFDEMLTSIKDDWASFSTLVHYVFLGTLQYHDVVPPGLPPEQ